MNCHRLLLGILSIALCVSAQAAGQRFMAVSGDRHKLRVDDPLVAARILADGGRLIADYGLFQVIEANAAAELTFSGSGKVENRDQDNRILFNAGEVDTTTDAVKLMRRAPAQFSGRRLHLVQFAGPVKPEWVKELEQAGLRIVTYIPNNAYLVYGDSAALAAASAMAASRPFVQWEGSYDVDDKIQPRARNRDSAGQYRALDTDLFAIQLVDDAVGNTDTLELIDSIKLAPLRHESRMLGYHSFVVRLPPDQVPVLAAQPDVVSINTYVEPKKFDERQDQIVAGNLNATGSYPTNAGYLAWLYSKGFTQDQFTASGFVVDVCDSGLDNGTTTPNHFGLYTLSDTAQASRVVYARLEGSANVGSTIQGCDGHGNLNAHIIGGYNNINTFPHVDSAGYRYGLGVCPFVKVGSSVIFDPDSFTDPDYEDMISRAYRDGARISSDSWGADTAGDYDIDAQRYDYLVRDAQPASAAVSSNGNQEMTIVFAAGNAGSSAQTVGSPGTAKNVITVGAAENVHSHASTNGGASATGDDGCTTPDSEANNANDIATFSSRGPCSDLRKKPEIVAPGTHITGGVAQQTRGATNGNDLACFEGTGVCGLPGGGTVGSAFNFFPTNKAQQLWTTSSGTSHSTPAVAGGCALIRQYFINIGQNAPSPAMVKAYLMNSARYMTGTDANDTLWSNDQGMGGMNLGLAFDGTARVLKDQPTNELFTATGQSRQYVGTISDTGKPFRVTLSWTDAPGSTSGNAYKNNLDLTVTLGGLTYKGNVFNGAYSTNGGSADVRNNTESVFLRAGQTGVVVVTVAAANINSDGVPNYGTALDQDFALVVYNATEGASNQPPVLASIGDKSVVTNTLLSFSVTASDPFDGDTVSLWATGVPPWATFTGATNAGGVTNTFSGTSSVTGTWTTTFYAGDVDGTNSETITITVTDGSAGCGVIISEYVEGSSNNKALEIYNGTGAALDLLASNYVVQIYFNGSATPGNSTTLTGTVAVGDAYVIVNSIAEASLLAMADRTWGNLTFNGDDAIVLRRGGASGAVVDSIGVVGTDPGTEWGSGLTSTADNTIRRKSLVTTGDTNTTDTFDPATEWDGYAVDTFDGLGSHTMSCGGAPANTPPVLSAIGNRSVVVSNTLQFAVTATPTESEAVTLTVSNAPAGTYFSSAGESGTFYWTNASPVGVYTTTFYAADAGGVDFEQILISVVAAGGGGGGGTETFSNSTAPAATYGSGSYVGDGSIQWTYSGARTPEALYTIDGTSLGFGDSTRNPREVYSSTIAGGVGSITVKYLKYFTGAGTRSFEVYVGATLVGTVSDANNATVATQTFSAIDISGDVVIKVVGTGGKQFVVDTLSWTSYAGGGDDTDGDGLSDAWEQDNFGTLTNAAAGDWDEDGVDNVSEFVSGTQPTNNQSYLQFETIMLQPSLGLQFETVTGRTYWIDFRTNLLAGDWAGLVSGLIGSNDVRTINDTNEFEHRTYRLGVQRN